MQQLIQLIRWFRAETQHLVDSVARPGRPNRPIGNVNTFLEDIKARNFQPTFILDIGANRGYWSRRAKEIFPEAAFLLIEPQAEMRQDLDTLCAKHPDIQWVEVGVGAQAGVLTQTIWEDLVGSSFLPAQRESFLKSGKQRQVQIITLDHLLQSRELKAPDLVKIDVQGFELEVLRGAETLFGKTEVFILETSLYRFMEGQPLLREVIAFMGDRGYEVYDITEYLRRPLDGALGQIDIAFAKQDGSLRHSHQWSSQDRYGTSEA
jgi:FkbM family methyltransferase